MDSVWSGHTGFGKPQLVSAEWDGGGQDNQTGAQVPHGGRIKSS